MELLLFQWRKFLICKVKPRLSQQKHHDKFITAHQCSHPWVCKQAQTRKDVKCGSSSSCHHKSLSDPFLLRRYQKVIIAASEKISRFGRVEGNDFSSSKSNEGIRNIIINVENLNDKFVTLRLVLRFKF